MEGGCKFQEENAVRVVKPVADSDYRGCCLPRRKPSSSKVTPMSSDGGRSVYLTFRPFFIGCRVCGLAPLCNATQRKSNHLHFRWRSVPTAITLLILTALIYSSSCSGYFYLVAPIDEELKTNDTRCNMTSPVRSYQIESLAVSPREVIFYLSATIYLLFSVLATRKLPEIFRFWDSACQRLEEHCVMDKTQGNFSQAAHMKTLYMWLVLIFFLSSAITEHVLHDIQVLAEQCGNSTDYLQCYYIRGHTYLSASIPYSRPLALAILVFNQAATLSWNHQDLLIILLGLELRQNFRVMVARVAQQAAIPDSGGGGGGKVMTSSSPRDRWRHLRLDCLALCDVVRMLDDVISPSILLSYAINLYFLCIQVFYAIRPYERSLLESAYFKSSFYHFTFKLCFVSYSASSFNEAAVESLDYLHRCPSESYSEEVTRFINLLTYSPPYFTGCKFFVITRSLFLSILSIIITYELILLNVA